MEAHHHPKARQAGKDNNKKNLMQKIISYMHISPDGFVAVPNGEMNRIKVDEERLDHVGKRISEGDTAPIAGCSLSPYCR